MSWHAVDDSLLERMAHAGLSIEHAYLHLEALAYCSRLATDGVIPEDLSLVSRIPNPIQGAVALWSIGMWQLHEVGGWEIVGYLDEQRSSERIEADKRRARERAERSRRHKSGDHSMCRPSYCKEAPPSESDTAREVRRTFTAGARGPYLISSDLTDEINTNDEGGRAPDESRAAVNREGLRRVRESLASTQTPPSDGDAE